MKRLKKMIVPITFIFAIIVTLVSQKVNVNASVNSYIKESKFKGNYYAQGKYSKLGYFLKIKSIENGKVKGYVDASNVSRELGADFTTSKIKKNKASFKFTDNWSNKGNGTILFNKNGIIKMTVKTTKIGSFSRAEFNFKNVTFSKKKPKKNTGTTKLSNGRYFTYHIGDSDSWEYDMAYCKRARIKDGKLTIWGSLDKYSSNNKVVSTKKYAKRVLSMSKNCKVCGTGDDNGKTIEEKMPKSEFNRIFDNTRSTINFMITVKNNKVTKILVLS